MLPEYRTCAYSTACAYNHQLRTPATASMAALAPEGIAKMYWVLSELCITDNVNFVQCYLYLFIYLKLVEETTNILR